MQKKLKVLTFAYVFPPDSGSGTFRTLYFSNHWARIEDRVTVVTVREKDFHASASVDQKLLEQVHPSIEIIRTRAIRPLDWLTTLRGRLSGSRQKSPEETPQSPPKVPPESSNRSHGLAQRAKDLISNLLTFPDIHNGWIPGAVHAAKRLTQVERFDCIYASGGPWSTVLAATVASRSCRIPLVIDFRDPWSSNPNLVEQSRFYQSAHRRLEAFCVKRASRIVANTEELRADFVSRYPAIPVDRFVCVTNGFEDLPRQAISRTSSLEIVHAGALYGSRDPSKFLAALASLIDDGKIPRNAIRVRFVGGMDVTRDGTRKALEHLTDVVEIIPHVPHHEAVALQQKAGVLLLFQTGFPLQVPRKLYEYFSIGLPIFAITEPNGATARTLRDIKSTYVAQDDVVEISATLLRLYRDWASEGGIRVDEEGIQRFSNRYLSEKLRSELIAAVQESTEEV